jgi:alkyldihydroxyacetonephosphate synthase
MYSSYDLPNLYDWVRDTVNIDIENPAPQQEEMTADEPKNVSHEFLKELEESKAYSRRSFENWERIMHSHGASLREVFCLRYSKFERYVDVVVYPGSTEHVKTIVELADKHNVILIPYGGGTNVT